MIKTLYQTSDGNTFNILHEAEEYEARKPYTISYTLEGFIQVVVYAKNERDAKLKANEMWYADDIDWNITNVEVEEG